MNKLVLMFVLGLGVSSIAQGAPLSYIFNNQSKSMVVFQKERTVVDACTAAAGIRPDAQFIEVATKDDQGHPIYVAC